MEYSVFQKNKLKDIYNNIQAVYTADSRPWVIGYSGGKDSTTVVQLIFTSLSMLAKDKLTKPVYIISSDTLIENPMIVSYIDTNLELIQKKAEELDLPITTHKVMPKYHKTFWSMLIGRGYPSPRQKFRWCTDRLKIDPANKFILDVVSSYGEAIVVLGVRVGESASRDQVLKSHKVEGKLLRRHTSLMNAYVYAPIEEFTVDDVWTYLMQVESPWGGNNGELLSLYQSSTAGECPLVIDKTTPTCGNSRFGCWVCTVVQEDKSLKGFIESGEEWLIPLYKFRRWIMEVRDNPDYREKKRRDGTVYHLGEGEEQKVGLGPFTLEARKEILKELLTVEKKVNYQLITPEELRFIRKEWYDVGDWEDFVPKIYKEIYNRELSWDFDEKPFFNQQELDMLKDLCEEEKVELELIKKLVALETQYYGYKHRHGILKDINKVMNEGWLHYTPRKLEKK